MIPSPTVNLRFAHAILQACSRLGVTVPEALTDQIRAQTERVPLSLQDDLWRAIAGAEPDPLIGLRMGAEVQVGHLDSVGLLLMSCETLDEALDALLEYFPIISEGSRFESQLTAEGRLLRYLPAFEECRDLRAEAVVGCTVQLARWITGTGLAPDRVTLRHPPRDSEDRYARLLGCPVRFRADDYSLHYPEAALATPLIQANPVMRGHLQKVADQMLASLAQASMSEQVRALVRHHPRWGRERIAGLLGVSGRHLNRRLAEEGSSFKLIHDATLHRMALEHLRGEASLRQVAQVLGFADESAFAKAFRRWAGLSPAQYRRQSER